MLILYLNYVLRDWKNHRTKLICDGAYLTKLEFVEMLWSYEGPKRRDNKGEKSALESDVRSG